MDPSLNSFKQQIEAAFQKSFQQLHQKNKLNRAIVSNLMEAAGDQSSRIAQLDQQIQNLKNTSTPQLKSMKKQMNEQEKLVVQNFDGMMMRLTEIEEGITNARITAERNMQINKQSQKGMNQLLRQLQNIEREEPVPPYNGSRDLLMKEVEQFEKVMDDEVQKMKQSTSNLQFAQKTSLEPVHTFQTKISAHNRNNQQLLKEKLSNFTNKLKSVERRVEQTSRAMNHESNRTKTEQKRIIQEMSCVQKQMNKLRIDLESADQKKKQEIQSSAATLDNMVADMLAQTKKLQVRVNNLKVGYSLQGDKIGMQ